MAKKGKTLWEMLTEKFQSPVELQYYNPLKARIGNAVLINEVEWRDYNFFLREIREYKRTIGSRQFPLADYVLLARPLGGDDVSLRLRLNPVDNPDRAGGLTHQVLMLRLDDEMAYSEDLHKVVTDTTKRFQVMDNGQVVEEYWRINDVSDSYKARVSIIRDVDSDGKVDKDEVESVELEYWDYWRDTTDEFGQALRQFLFVEMDRDSGWFQLWRGQEMDPQHIVVM